MLAAGLALLSLLASGAPARADRPEVLVFAAASLADALTEAGRAYEAAGRGRVAFNFAASNDLARQIEAGAPAQVFLSANREQVERLERAGRVRPGEAFAFLGNTLVVIVPRGSDVRSLAGARDLLGFDRLSLADPAAVPAGIYARTWLEREGLWARLAPRVVPALDVRAALAAVAAGNLPAGVVYATDATSSERVRVVFRVPVAASPEVRCYAAPLLETGKPGARPGTDFLAFLRGPEAAAIFARHGFTPLAGAAAPARPAPVRRQPGG